MVATMKRKTKGPRKADPNMRQIGARIRRLREELFPDESQGKFAYDAGITPSCLSNIETGLRKGDIISLSRIARHLAASLDYLVFGTDGQDKRPGPSVQQ